VNGIVTEIWGKYTTTWANPEDQEQQKCFLPSDNKTAQV
jgi:hypothetical protein